MGPSGNVLSGHLTWIPIESQTETFALGGVSVVYPDILLAKLGPGQAIEFEAHCRKGVGKDHAKFQPVATVAYRLLPEISLSEDIINDSARMLKSLCPSGVFDIEEIGSEIKAKVSRPRNCTMCGECVREKGLEKKVQICRHDKKFIFTVESVGAVAPQTIVQESLRVLSMKCKDLIDHIDAS